MIIERQNSRAASAADTVGARTRRSQIRQAHIQERALPTTVIRIAALTALSVLGACVHPSPIQVSADGTQFAINPRFSMPSGTTQKLLFAFNVRPDCSFVDVPVSRLVDQPAHGKLQIAQVEDYPNYPLLNPRYKCNTVPVKGVRISYTPDPGYVGTDEFVYEVFLGGKVIRSHAVGNVL
jgi:hypothetical protein